MSQQDHPTAQHFSGIHIEGDSRVHLGNTYISDNEFYTTLDQLSPIDNNGGLRYNDPLEGSTDWFIKGESYLTWRDGGVDTLWCDGPPGTGKTVMMACAAMDLLHHTGGTTSEAVFVAYFASYKTRSAESVQDALASIARQLIQTRPALLGTLKERLKLRDVHSRQWVLDLLAELSHNFKTVYLVLDALDELASSLEDRLDMVTALCSLHDRIKDTTAFKVCLSSRMDGQSQEALEPCTAIYIQATAESIRTFITDYLKRATTLKRLPETSDLYKDIVCTVEQRSGRIFKLADLQMQYLASLTNTLKIRRELPGLSTQFNFYYSQSLSRINAKPLLKASIFNLISWLVCSRSPLHTDELSQCLPIEEGIEPGTAIEDLDEDVHRVVAETEGLVKIDPPSGGVGMGGGPPLHCPVSFAHETIYAYLTKAKDEWYTSSIAPEWYVCIGGARFMSLAVCSEEIIAHTIASLQAPRNLLERLGHCPAFLAWCIQHWDEQFPSYSEPSSEAATALHSLAVKLLLHGKAAGIDPIFCSALFDWKTFAASLIDSGSDLRSTWCGVDAANVSFALGKSEMGCRFLQLANMKGTKPATSYANVGNATRPKVIRNIILQLLEGSKEWRRSVARLPRMSKDEMVSTIEQHANGKYVVRHHTHDRG